MSSLRERGGHAGGGVNKSGTAGHSRSSTAGSGRQEQRASPSSIPWKPPSSAVPLKLNPNSMVWVEPEDDIVQSDEDDFQKPRSNPQNRRQLTPSDSRISHLKTSQTSYSMGMGSPDDLTTCKGILPFHSILPEKSALRSSSTRAAKRPDFILNDPNAEKFSPVGAGTRLNFQGARGIPITIPSNKPNHLPALSSSKRNADRFGHPENRFHINRLMQGKVNEVLPLSQPRVSHPVKSKVLAVAARIDCHVKATQSTSITPSASSSQRRSIVSQNEVIEIQDDDDDDQKTANTVGSIPLTRPQSFVAGLSSSSSSASVIQMSQAETLATDHHQTRSPYFQQPDLVNEISEESLTSPVGKAAKKIKGMKPKGETKSIKQQANFRCKLKMVAFDGNRLPAYSDPSISLSRSNGVEQWSIFDSKTKSTTSIFAGDIVHFYRSTTNQTTEAVYIWIELSPNAEFSNIMATADSKNVNKLLQKCSYIVDMPSESYAVCVAGVDSALISARPPTRQSLAGSNSLPFDSGILQPIRPLNVGHSRLLRETARKSLSPPPPPPSRLRIEPDRELFIYTGKLPGSVRVGTHDLACLDPGEFLNDVIIEFYLRHLLDNEFPEGISNSIYLFSSFFYDQLTRASDLRAGYESVKKWIKEDIFSKKFLIFPINEHLHWYLVIIYNPAAMIEPPALDDLPTEVIDTDAVPQSSPHASPSSGLIVLDDDDDNDDANDAIGPDKIFSVDKSIGLHTTSLSACVSSDVTEAPDVVPMDTAEDEKIDFVPDSQAERLPNFKSHFNANLISESVLAFQKAQTGKNRNPDRRPSFSDDIASDTGESDGIGTKMKRKCLVRTIELDDDEDDDDLSPVSEILQQQILVAPKKISSESFYTSSGSVISDLKPPAFLPSSADVLYSDSRARTKESYFHAEPRRSARQAASFSGQVAPIFNYVATPRAKLRISEMAQTIQTYKSVHRPHIFLFDSLSGSRQKTLVNLKKFMAMELQAKKDMEPLQSIVQIQVKAPKQNNHCDCGVFLLQYVETFFKNSDQYLNLIFNHLPAGNEWFKLSDIVQKRKNIIALIETHHKDLLASQELSSPEPSRILSSTFAKKEMDDDDDDDEVIQIS